MRHPAARSIFIFNRLARKFAFCELYPGERTRERPILEAPAPREGWPEVALPLPK